MPSYDYKIVEWSSYDGVTPEEVIQAEATGRWEYYDNIQRHSNRIDFVFRRPAGT